MSWRLLQLALLVIALILALAVVVQLDDPAFTAVRAWAATGLIVLGLGMALLHIRARGWMRASFGVACLSACWVAGWLMVAGLAGHVLYVPHAARNSILQAAEREPARMAALGEHLVIGYDDSAEVRELARRGLIGGVFVTKHNIVGKTSTQLRAELDGFQDVRRRAGLPPLLIATDQEGGAVSRLSPLVPYQPPLASLANAPDAEQRTAEYGSRQGRALAELGINANFSPVVDLKPEHPPDPSDRHTRIAERAIAADPGIVSGVALAYSRALVSQGVMPTLKHFPGLGNVVGDTHRNSAHLTTPLAQLMARDWLPFRYVLDHVPAMLMVSHVTLDAIDPSAPASLSRSVLTGLLREHWQYQGVLISDDLSMAAVYDRGLCHASLAAINAGQDLLLISYDWRKYYSVMDCLRQAMDAGKLPDLSPSHRRLDAQPWRRAASSNDNELRLCEGSDPVPNLAI